MTMTQQQLRKRVRKPEVREQDLRTPSGRMLPY
jgi:hypothetical protein